MSKVAVFVEGLTEAELTISMLTQLCGSRGISIEVHHQHGGQLHFLEMRGSAGAPLFALVANCSCDGQVKTQIRDRYADLVKAGYTRIIGVRDVYPESRANLHRLEAMKTYGMPTGSVPIDLHLAVMEVEAWFLDEITHFERIHAALTPARISSGGFDVGSVSGETWDHPAETLHQIYKLEGLAYKKTGDHIRRTVGALCMNELYSTAAGRSASLAGYINSLELALFPLPTPVPAAAAN